MSSHPFLCSPTPGMLQGMLTEAGACAAGVCACAEVPAADRILLQAWLARGCHGGMDYLERNAPLASDPATLLPGARTVRC
ncbi:MAG: hypothetical protein K2L16_04100, partial [Muribaculaceae bacterium]|nr:hypothetical protein [Muribaculaceae bacterium]